MVAVGSLGLLGGKTGLTESLLERRAGGRGRAGTPGGATGQYSRIISRSLEL